MYKLIQNGVQRLADGACIPNDSANRDWQGYQQWAAAGNAPAPEFTADEIAARDKERKNIEARTALESLDRQSIRTLREYLTAANQGERDTALQTLRDLEASSKVERQKIR